MLLNKYRMSKKHFKKRMLAVCAGMMFVALIPLAAFLIGAEHFPQWRLEDTLLSQQSHF